MYIVIIKILKMIFIHIKLIFLTAKLFDIAKKRLFNRTA
jgi:hypothetical protein